MGILGGEEHQRRGGVGDELSPRVGGIRLGQAQRNIDPPVVDEHDALLVLADAVLAPLDHLQAFPRRRDAEERHKELIETERASLIEGVVTESEDEDLMERFIGGEHVENDLLATDLEKAVAADPQDLDSLEKLAVAHYQLKEYDQAAEAYLKILAQVDDAFTHNNLGNVYRDQKKHDQAIAQYLKAIELDPTLKQPYINLARVYKENDQLAKAIAILEQAKTALNSADVESVKKLSLIHI